MTLERFAHVAQDPTRFAELSPTDRHALGQALRDRFFALSESKTHDPVFHALVDTFVAAPTTRLEGLSVSWHPTATHKTVRFVDAARLDEETRAASARRGPGLAAVFADPRELSLRTFENIIPLGPRFDGASIELVKAKSLSPRGEAWSWTVEASAKTREALASLDLLGLYVPPLNACARGGERFIFHSAALADALTKAVKAALPKGAKKKLSHVNPVFRCNRFEPGDDRFHAHLDTPYFDRARHHVSRYTVLLYVTGGVGAPALQIGPDVTLEAIAPMTCVVFDQRLEHEGGPFTDGRKVFLRTELIFEDEAIDEDPRIGALFSKACYLTGESVFQPELARWADAYYDRVAAAHWEGLKERRAKEPLLRKERDGVVFVTNGYDYWFRAEALSPEESAAIALLDHFNCVVGGEPFRAQCRTETVLEDAADRSAIARLLAHPGEARRVPSLTEREKDAHLFPPSEEDNGACCPFHEWRTFDPTVHGEIIALNEKAQELAKAHVLPAPILMMHDEVFLDPAKFRVEDGFIHVLGEGSLRPVNFAACWNSGGMPANYIDVESTVSVVQLLVPPIGHKEDNGVRHLSFDFFRNGWMVQHRQDRVPIPRIRDYDESFEDGGDTPFATAVPRELRDLKKAWWSKNLPTLDESFDVEELDDLDEEDED